MGVDHGAHQADPFGKPGGQQCRHPGEQIGAEEQGTEHALVDPVADMQPPGDHALDDKAAGKGIEGKEGTELEHHLVRSVQAQGSFACARRGRCHRSHLHLPGNKEEEQKQRQTAGRIAGHDEPVCLQTAPADGLQPLRQPAARQGPGRGGERPGEIVPAEKPGAPVVRNQLGERRLLDGQKRPDLAAAGADDADDRRQGDPHRVGGAEEDQAGQDHQCRPEQEHVPAANPVSHHSHPEGDENITGQGGGENGPDTRYAQPCGSEIQGQHHRDEPVGEQPDGSGGKEQNDVSGGDMHGDSPISPGGGRLRGKVDQAIQPWISACRAR